jgi:hypothetical protein
VHVPRSDGGELELVEAQDAGVIELVEISIDTRVLRRDIFCTDRKRLGHGHLSGFGRRFG